MTAPTTGLAAPLRVIDTLEDVQDLIELAIHFFDSKDRAQRAPLTALGLANIDLDGLLIELRKAHAEELKEWETAE